MVAEEMFGRILAPYVTLLVNKSLSEGVMPSCMKQAIVTPILKKRNADHTDLSNYRPVSNLSFLSKLIEKVVLHQLTEYLECNALLPVCQSCQSLDKDSITPCLLRSRHRVGCRKYFDPSTLGS